MAERKTVATVSVITDSETSYDNIGDIDGGYFDPEWLKNHIKSHGAEGLFKQIAYMSFQVWEAMRAVNLENDGNSGVAEKIR